MIGDDPKKIAMLIMSKDKKSKAEPESDFDEGESGSGNAGADALKDMFKMGRAGDFSGAFDALKMAVAACQEDEY